MMNSSSSNGNQLKILFQARICNRIAIIPAVENTLPQLVKRISSMRILHVNYRLRILPLKPYNRIQQCYNETFSALRSPYRDHGIFPTPFAPRPSP